jgi:hypothetical protein
MEQQKVDMFVGLNCENFNPQDLMTIKQKLEQMDDSKFFWFRVLNFKSLLRFYLSQSYLAGKDFG